MFGQEPLESHFNKLLNINPNFWLCIIGTTIMQFMQPHKPSGWTYGSNLKQLFAYAGCELLKYLMCIIGIFKSFRE